MIKAGFSVRQYTGLTLQRVLCGTPIVIRPRTSHLPRRISIIVKSSFNVPRKKEDVLLLYDSLRARTRLLLDWIVSSFNSVWEKQQHWMKYTATKIALALSLSIFIVHAAVNIWLVPELNERLLPKAAKQAAAVLQRDVQLGGVKWLAPTGITGLTPLAAVGPLSIGQCPLESSSATIDTVLVHLDVLRSLTLGRLVLTADGRNADVHLKQADNFSWFGYPEDTFPSSRNFLPGLKTKKKPPTSTGDGGGGGEVSAPRIKKQRQYVSPPPPSTFTPFAFPTMETMIDILEHAAGQGPDYKGEEEVLGPLLLSTDSIGQARQHTFTSPIDLFRIDGRSPLNKAGEPSRFLGGAVSKLFSSSEPSTSNKNSSADAQIAELNKLELKRDVREAIGLTTKNDPKVSKKGDDDGGSSAKHDEKQHRKKRRRKTGLSPVLILDVEEDEEGPSSGDGEALTTPFSPDSMTPSIQDDPTNKPVVEDELDERRAASSALGAPNIMAEDDEECDDVPETPAASPNVGKISLDKESLAGIKSITSEGLLASYGKTIRKQSSFSRVITHPTSYKKLGSQRLPWANERLPAALAIKKSKMVEPEFPSNKNGAHEQELDTDSDKYEENIARIVPATRYTTSAERLYKEEASLLVENKEDMMMKMKSAAPTMNENSSTVTPSLGPPIERSSESPSGAQHRHQGTLLHPGYFRIDGRPAYTPAPPEALMDARARQRTLGSMLRSFVVSHAPQVTLGSVQLQGATVHAHITGESFPRKFDKVDAVLTFIGREYDHLKLDLTAEPHERLARSKKCTMPSPFAHRHLRHLTGVEALTKAKARGLIAEEEPHVRELDEYKSKPAGGKLRVQVIAKDISKGAPPKGSLPNTPCADMTITVTGKDLHAPLIERIIELPMDINAGRVNGSLTIRSATPSGWQYPEFSGRLAVRGSEFHFWDATDDVLDADLDLVFEGRRLYLHNAVGKFGAVPLTVTGDLDIYPDWGEYRLSAKVDKSNAVDINQLRASLGVRPTPFPVTGAITGTLHVTGPLEKPIFSGRAVVVRPSNEALADCELTHAKLALSSESEAVGAYDLVPFSSASLVFSVDMTTNIMTLNEVKASPIGGGELQGYGEMNVSPHAEDDPTAVSIRVSGIGLPGDALASRYVENSGVVEGGNASLPTALVLGPADIEATMKGSHLAPVIDVKFGVSETNAKGRVTFKRESTAIDLTSPQFDVSAVMHVNPASIADVKAAITQEMATALARPNIRGGDGEVSMRGVDIVPYLSDDAALRQIAAQPGQPLRLKVNGNAKFNGSVVRKEKNAWLFDGSFGLENVRLNQLRLFKKLTGTMQVAEDKASIHGKGFRSDEVLDLDVDLPLLPPLDRSPAAEEDKEQDKEEQQQSRTGTNMVMRCGQLMMLGDMDASGSTIGCSIKNLPLDELELGSLRGDLQEASALLNFKTAKGQGRLAIAHPKYSGVQGDSLSGGFRWERDVIRLEKAVLQQRQSRYEVQGDYTLPASVKLPANAAELVGSGDGAASGGRWRIQVGVPGAEVQDVLPAARMLQDATSSFPTNYERAKGSFLEGVKKMHVAASDLNTQLQKALTKSQIAAHVAPLKNVVRPRKNEEKESVGGPLPGLQDAQGQYSGTVQAYGGGGGATNVDFDMRGQMWSWGGYVIDSVNASGGYHSEEGVHLEEFVLNKGDAKLVLQGSLLGERQDATLRITDFPVATLRPIFKAVPALARAVPAVSVREPTVVPSPYPLGTLTHALGRANEGLEQHDSPINGLLYVSGALGGSMQQPTGEVAVRLYDAAIGKTRLSQAQATARLNDVQQLSFNVDIVPAEGHRQSGHVRAAGVVPLILLDGSAAGATTAPQLEGSSTIDVRLSVKDNGMAVLTSVTPEVHWQGGDADVAFRLYGSHHAPTLSGSASVLKATIDAPGILKSPLTGLTAEVNCEEGQLSVDRLEGKIGRKGFIRMKGYLPIRKQNSVRNRHHHHQHGARLTAEFHALDLRVPNVYSGQYDGVIHLTDSVTSPVIGGHMRFSRGTIFLTPQGAMGDDENVSPLLTPDKVVVSAEGPVARTFKVLTRGSDDGGGALLASSFEEVVRQEREAVEALVADAAQHNVHLDRLMIALGPDTRAVYPLVMNFVLAGELEASGPPRPDAVSLQGMLRLASGDVNLLATQLNLDRNHPNTILFGQGSGAIDPQVDLAFSSGDLRLTILGKASEWQDHLQLSAVGSAPGEAGAEALDAADAARVLEEKLKEALLADDGQLALSKLAGSTVSNLIPKIETSGAFGGTRWRLMSAPAIGGLLDPTNVDPSGLFGAITMGTEVEVQFGRRLNAAMVRQLKESDVETRWTLSYLLSNKLRMQFGVTSAPPYTKTIIFQFSSEQQQQNNKPGS